MRKGEVLIGASVLAGLNIGSSIGKAISRNSLRNALREKFQDHFVDTVLEMMDSGIAPEAAVEAAFSKFVYQSLFRKYGEEAADFYLSKYNKAKTMGVEYDYDVEIAKYLDSVGNKHLAKPYTDLLLGIVTTNPAAPLQKTYSAEPPSRLVNADTSMRNMLSEACVVIATGVKFGRLPNGGILSKKGFVFNNVKYELEAEAEAQMDAYIEALKTPKIIEAARRLLQEAEREIKRINALTVTHGKLQYEGWGATPKYRIAELPDVEFVKKEKMDEYIAALRKPHEDNIVGCKTLLAGN